MDEQIRREFDEIRAVLAQTAQQQAQFQDSLNETRALQQRNTEAISQQLQMWSDLRQALVEQNRLVQSNRADIARLDEENRGGLN
jgi:hypothetical protein